VEKPDTAKAKNDIPGKRGDRVVCHINGEDISGTIYSDEISDGQLIYILLDKKIKGGTHLQEYSVGLGVDNMSDTEMIEKTGEASPEEMVRVLDRVKQLHQLDMSGYLSNT